MCPFLTCPTLKLLKIPCFDIEFIACKRCNCFQCRFIHCRPARHCPYARHSEHMWPRCSRRIHRSRPEFWTQQVHPQPSSSLHGVPYSHIAHEMLHRTIYFPHQISHQSQERIRALEYCQQSSDQQLLAAQEYACNVLQSVPLHYPIPNNVYRYEDSVWQGALNVSNYGQTSAIDTYSQIGM